jgi:acetylornithine deacetylase/succinyl-diaminopimelate desuccinylase-like protein
MDGEIFSGDGLAPESRITAADHARLAAAIDAEELLDLALTLSNIDSPSRHEAQAGQFVFDWLAREGFSPRKVGATPERFNVIGHYGGGGFGKNLLFTAHLDTESPTWDPDLDAYKYTPATLADPEWRKCWLEDGVLYGFPIANDRGPMSCFMIAAKALKTAGYDLAGRMYLTACPGEIGPEPIEELRGVDYLGKDIGAHYLFHHGGVSPDYVIAAEGSDFGQTWVGCGYAVFRLRLLGDGAFTPILDHPADARAHPNPIHRLAPVIEALNAWTLAYPERHRYETKGGLAIPRAQIDAIRGGLPHTFGAGTQICNIYLEAGLTPRQHVADIQRELERLLAGLKVGPFEIEPVVVRYGAEANDAAIAPLATAVSAATQLTRGHPAARAPSVYSSMWRDHNVFNTQRIPALTTGFARWRSSPKDLLDSALIYGLTALAICGPAPSEPAVSAPPPPQSEP